MYFPSCISLFHSIVKKKEKKREIISLITLRLNGLAECNILTRITSIIYETIK